MHCRHFRAHLASVITLAGLLGLVVCPGCWRTDSLPAEDPARLTIQLRSAAFADGELIPKKDFVRPAGRIGISSGSKRSTLDLS